LGNQKSVREGIGLAVRRQQRDKKKNDFVNKAKHSAALLIMLTTIAGAVVVF